MWLTQKTTAPLVMQVVNPAKKYKLLKIALPVDYYRRLYFLSELGYTPSVDLEIVCKPSAFKHSVTEADIRWAFNTAKYDRWVEGFENKYLLIGFGVHGNLLEVMYNDLGENRVNVFHAMKCRNALLPLINQ